MSYEQSLIFMLDRRRQVKHRGGLAIERIIGESAIELPMSITFTPEQESLVQSLLETGQFSTSEQVIQVALRLLKKVQQEKQEWIEETRAKVNEGLAEIERGETLDGETFVNQILNKLEQRKEAQE